MPFNSLPLLFIKYDIEIENLLSPSLPCFLPSSSLLCLSFYAVQAVLVLTMFPLPNINRTAVSPLGSHTRLSMPISSLLAIG